MADIVIRGVDVPKGDLEYVSLLVYGDGRVYTRKAGAACSQRLQDLVISLPEGYGKLIDVDALEDMELETCDTDDGFRTKDRVAGRNYIRNIIKSAQVILEAEVKEDG